MIDRLLHLSGSIITSKLLCSKLLFYKMKPLSLLSDFLRLFSEECLENNPK